MPQGVRDGGDEPGARWEQTYTPFSFRPQAQELLLGYAKQSCFGKPDYSFSFLGLWRLLRDFSNLYLSFPISEIKGKSFSGRWPGLGLFLGPLRCRLAGGEVHQSRVRESKPCCPARDTLLPHRVPGTQSLPRTTGIHRNAGSFPPTSPSQAWGAWGGDPIFLQPNTSFQ